LYKYLIKKIQVYRITLNLAKKLSRRNKHLYWHRLNSIYHWGSKLHLLIVHVAVNFITGIMYILPYIPYLNQQCGHNVFSIIGGKNLSARENMYIIMTPTLFHSFLKKIVYTNPPTFIWELRGGKTFAFVSKLTFKSVNSDLIKILCIHRKFIKCYF
jgi:hypothetical protein